jgi:hypothetical protein
MSSTSVVGGNRYPVRLLRSEDGCFLLDIEHDRILKLNLVGAEIWHLLSQGNQEAEIVAAIAQKYQVDVHQVKADVRAILRKITEFRLSPDLSIDSTDQPKPARKKQPSYPWYGQTAGEDQSLKAKGAIVIAALFGLAVFDLILSISSLKVLCGCVKAWPIHKRKSTEADIAGKICIAVQEASVWYPKRTLCLQRSAVTTCLLRIYGLTAQMVVGVRPMPFMAHAWVEVDNAVVNDWPGVAKFYRPLVSH